MSYKIPRDVEKSLSDKVRTTLIQLGYKDVSLTGEIPIGNQKISVRFRQTHSSDVWVRGRDYGMIHVKYEHNYTTVIARRVKIKFAWESPSALEFEATSFCWSEKITEELKRKVDEVYQRAKESVEYRSKVQALESEFALAIHGIFPNAEINGFSATIDGLKIRSTGDSFSYEFTRTGSGSLEEIKSITEAMEKCQK